MRIQYLFPVFLDLHHTCSFSGQPFQWVLATLPSNVLNTLLFPVLFPVTMPHHDVRIFANIADLDYQQC